MKITTIIDIDVPAARAWKVAGEQFGQVSEWAGPVLSSHLDSPLAEGAVRTCEIRAVGPFPPGEITETLIEFNRQQRSLAYTVGTGKPPILKHLSNRWTIEETGTTKCRLTSTATVTMAWWALPLLPFVRHGLAKNIRAILGQYKDYVTAQLPTQQKASPRPVAAAV